MPDLVIDPATDWEEAVSRLAAANLASAERRGTPKSPAAAQAFAVARLNPAFTAARLGHAVVWDPPAALTSVRARWTCTRPACGQAILVAADGRMYGGATSPCGAA